ncbi:5'-methylthioadenosine/S-adenosylhomocysteine nucleosidase [Actinospica durhamensis]|uniref:5'-methylthioadenosine/S-adenosylhomocysteine nucleosidase n=1 Tax=Actinospica durhamensis TaxID=1508375 RepID=A0A941EUF7_9ACTN|nr:5'-methylthioadenosine/S-adenosylhomocysteine nucleosidase [Actinospica durhamensis]MBR7837496.1 5'-methylthioadenosine/S-adenosylhomocysteine nucleosidase [Actinospica durhamensis]
MTQTPVAFVIAMMEEAEGIFRLGAWEELSLSPFPVYRVGESEAQAVVVLSGIGTTNAAAATQHVLDRFAPDRVVNLGVVGCLNHDIPIGAVHAVSTCAFFDVDVTAFGYKIGQIPETEVHEYPLAGAVEAGDLPTAKVLSGDTFVTGRDGFHPELAGFAADFVDMELTAIAHTLLRNGLLDRLESYKAPSDYCDSESPDAFDENLPYALSHLSTVADLILHAHGIEAGATAGVGR